MGVAERSAHGRVRRLIRRDREFPQPSSLIVVGMWALSYAVAFIQRPGRTFTDTRIELSLDPVRFLHNVAAVWSSTEDLGHVQSGQFVGYLAPMAPWYAFAHTIGIPTWVAERLWLGTLLGLAGWGVVRLMETLLGRRAGVAHAVAGALFIANPYVVVAISRATVVLLAYAALPWLLVLTHKGVRNPSSWRRPAIVGLIFAFTGGGVNAALLFWIALAPIALVLYEVLVLRAVSWRASAAFAARSCVCVVIGSLWWVVPVLLQTRYGPDFLKFTEQPYAIFATPSISESLRLLGYWVTYFAVGQTKFLPTVGSAGLYLFNPLVITASFAVPLIAFGGVIRTRRWVYAPFFLMLAMAALVIMSIGFPPGSPMNHLIVFAYFRVGALQHRCWPCRSPVSAAWRWQRSSTCCVRAAVSRCGAFACQCGPPLLWPRCWCCGRCRCSTAPLSMETRRTVRSPATGEQRCAMRLARRLPISGS
jgi:arabinofuranan 3-O-arabinosyltransferase